jgi:hypothetical protein
MNSGDRQDPRWMILILIGGLSIAAWRTISTISLGQVLSAVGSLAPFALGAIAIASALAMQRLLSTNRTLASRREVAVVPADDFDPKTDAVLRFAAELAATERSVLGWVDRRASAVRVRLTCDEEGRLVYLLGVPERSLKLLRGALRTYDGIELRDPKDVLGKRRAVEGLAAVRTELVLARPSLEPLARLSLEPDPLQPFAAALSAVRARSSGRRSASVWISFRPRDDGASVCAAPCVGELSASTASDAACWSASKMTGAAEDGLAPTSCSSGGWSTRRLTRNCATPGRCLRRSS